MSSSIARVTASGMKKRRPQLKKEPRRPRNTEGIMSTAAITANTASSAGISLPAFTLWWREVVRFYRQRARVIGVILSPLLFWIVIGSGFGTSFRSGAGPGQQHYLDYFYPGALVM